MPDSAAISLAGPLDGFAPISLAEMDAVQLMNRVDTKYLTDRATLADVLRDAAAAGYRVLVADGSRISPYDSIYCQFRGRFPGDQAEEQPRPDEEEAHRHPDGRPPGFPGQ